MDLGHLAILVPASVFSIVARHLLSIHLDFETGEGGQELRRAGQ